MRLGVATLGFHESGEQTMLFVGVPLVAVEELEEQGLGNGHEVVVCDGEAAEVFDGFEVHGSVLGAWFFVLGLARWRALEFGVFGEPGVGEVDGGAAAAVEGEAVGAHGSDVAAIDTEGGGEGFAVQERVARVNGAGAEHGSDGAGGLHGRK